MLALILPPPDSVSHLSSLHATVKNCSYTTSYSTLAMFPEPEVRAGLYSAARSDFYMEIPKTAWQSQKHENGSWTQYYTDYTFQVRALWKFVLSSYSAARHGTHGAAPSDRREAIIQEKKRRIYKKKCRIELPEHIGYTCPSLVSLTVPSGLHIILWHILATAPVKRVCRIGMNQILIF